MQGSTLKDIQDKIINPIPPTELDLLFERMYFTPMIPRDKDPYWIHKREMEELEKNMKQNN